jgi:hypothetical protein
MRPHRALVYSPHADIEFRRNALAQRAGLLDGLGIEINVGVIALDR